MPDTREGPQVTLITPPEVDLLGFPDRLALCLDAVPVACLRIALGLRDEDRLARSADALREVAHARDVAVVVQGPPELAQRLGLDGVHLVDGSRFVRAVRKALGADAIVGAFCSASRHEGLTAGEHGADYVSFGPWGSAERDLFAWWSEMIEVPVIAEGGLDAAAVRDLAPVTDFFAFGPEVWSAEDPVAALRELAAAMA
jgi:thiamine-phosphate pyrophosphorylase